MNSRAHRAVLASILVSLVAGCAGGGGGGFPPPVVPPRPTATDWPDVGGVLLEDIGTLTYRVMKLEGKAPRLVAELVHRQRYKILDSAGIALGKFRLPIDGYSTVTSVSARSVGPNGSVSNMSGSAVRAVGRDDERQRASDIKDLVFEVPDVRVGGLIDVTYRRLYTSAPLVPPSIFGRRQPVLRGELAVVVERGIKVDFRYADGVNLREAQPLRRDEPGGRQRFVFVERDLPPFFDEPRMPHRTRVAPWVGVVVTSAKVGKKRLRMSTWRDVAVYTLDQLERVGGKSGSGSAEARFRAVRDEVVPLDIDGLGIRSPVPEAGLLHGEPACSRDATALLWSRLKGSDVKAFPALLTGPTGPPVFDGFPSLYPFVRAVVAVDVSERVARDPTCREDPISRGLLCSVPEDSYAFLDPLCKGCRFGELPTHLTGGRAMVILPRGPRWVDVPQDPPERNRMMSQFRMSLDVDGSLDGTMNGELTGSMARELRDIYSRKRPTEAERDELFAGYLLGSDARPRLEHATATPKRKVDRPLKVRSKVKAQLEKLGYEKFRLNPIDLVGSILPGRWRSSRRYDAVMQAPAWIETVASIELPVGYEVEPRPMTKIVESFGEYAAGFARRERVLSYSRRLVLKKLVITAAEWPRFHDFLDQIAASEQYGVEVWLLDDSQ